jgi:RNA polymerase sigma factor (sigma-70 family)
MRTEPHSWLTDALRDALRSLARRRVPEADVDDVVQLVLCEAASSPHRPDDPARVRRWLYGILRHKIADYHRRPKREEPTDLDREPLARESDAGDPQEVRSLLAWAMRELPPGMDSRRTLEWLLRESEGETLEEIAMAEQLSPEQVRQRVSRLRRFFRQRWVAQIAAAMAVALLFVALALVWPKRSPLDVQADRTVAPRRESLPAIGNGVFPVDASVDSGADAAVDAINAVFEAPDPFADLRSTSTTSTPSRPRSGRTPRGGSSIPTGSSF